MYKQLLLSFAAITLYHALFAQITTDPGTGNIGIKTTTPEVPLHVIGESRFNGSGWFSRSNNGTLTTALALGQNYNYDYPSVTIKTSDDGGWNYAYWNSSRYGHLLTFQRESAVGRINIARIGGGDDGHNILLYSASDGQTVKTQFNSDIGSFIGESLAIGMTSSPSSKLHIQTYADYDGMQITHKGTGIIRFQANSLRALAWNDITREGDAGIIFGDQSGQNNVNYGFVLAPWRDGGSSGLRIDQSGSVSIATNITDPNSKLLVNGRIRARKVRVDTDTWPDYVFNQDYQLPPITEVAAFIQKHKHLPGVPSASEVKQSGIDLGDNQEVLLKKIEELTLYIIDQQKQIDELKKKNDRIETLAKELKELKKNR